MEFSKNFIISSLFFTLLLLSASCTTLKALYSKDSSDDYGQYSQIFFAPYNVVWQSTSLTLKDYPAEEVTQEGGQIILDVISYGDVWEPPKDSIPNQVNRRYRIKIFLERVKIQNRKGVKVQVIKEEFVNRDFIQESIPIISSGIEEKVILYRIGREISLYMEKVKIIERNQS